MVRYKQGIIEVGEERWIPGSRRADGSYRKERKVRPGFTPLEDLQRYASPAARRQQQATTPPPAPEKKKPTHGDQPKPTSDASAEQRKIKALQKKLRQIEELEQKMIRGEKLDENQADKVKKGKAVRNELAQLTGASS
ncbi:hypothetical protein K492DRAFT_208146 [Lichtheimia hyalospora FSU 10163]|nr:hypothetical protein K492DRAFT_208146 [Lichtheimia hyalospora FSU 10163]